MKNFEYYAAGNKDAMVQMYALRGVMVDHKAYRPEDLLKAQYRVYNEWLSHVKKSATKPDLFFCSFYEWMLRNADSAFVVKPGGTS